MSLIKVDDVLVVNTSEISWATRNGNYTDIRVKDRQLLSIWDEHERLWRAICKAAEKAE